MMEERGGGEKMVKSSMKHKKFLEHFSLKAPLPGLHIIT